MAVRQSQAFSGSEREAYRVLGEDFLAWKRERLLREDPSRLLPSLQAMKKVYPSSGAAHSGPKSLLTPRRKERRACLFAASILLFRKSA